MNELNRIKDMVYDELAELGHYEKLNKEAVCIIGELVDILKDIGTVEMFEENIYVDDNGMYHNGEERGYSQGYMPKRYYDGGNSYRSGRFYDNYGYARRGRGGYSREDGKEHMIEKLHQLMNETQNDHDRESINRLIQQMKDN